MTEPIGQKGETKEDDKLQESTDSLYNTIHDTPVDEEEQEEEDEDEEEEDEDDL